MLNKVIAFVVFFFFPTLLLANDEVQEGLRVMTEVDRRDNGWVDYTVDLTMILSNARGETSERQIRMKSKETEGDGDRTLLVFDTPPDVRGTGLLTHTQLSGEDDQWLYLPALKRIKRIASKNKSGPFVGSEFAYEDLTSQEVSKYSYKYLNDETIDGNEHFVWDTGNMLRRCTTARIPTISISGSPPEPPHLLGGLRSPNPPLGACCP